MIYFGFSDEAGSYKKERSNNFIKSHPFYIRSLVLFDADKWPEINNRFTSLKNKYSLPLDKEIKWSHIWSLYKSKGKPIHKSKAHYFLRNFEVDVLCSFVKNTIEILEYYESKIIITSYPNNDTHNLFDEKTFYKMHLQDIMQRIEMQIQNEDNLCCIYIDSINETKNRLIREAYHDIYEKGDFIKKYKHIFDSVNIVYSHHSVGVQIADFVAGVFNGFMRGFEKSSDIFKDTIYNKLCTSNDGKIIGIGIVDVPKIKKHREDLSNKISYM